MNDGNIALRNLNETTRKYKRWVDRWYYNCGSLECRICSGIIHDKYSVCLYDDKSRKELYAKDECSSTLTATYWKGYGGGRPMIKESKPVQMNYRSNVNSNMKERVQDRDETWTLTSNSNDFTITDNHRVRKLTPIECERLQGFADDWTKGISDTQRWKCIGNAVTTKVVKYIVGYLK